MKLTALLAVTLAAFASAAAVAQPEPEISELERRLIIGAPLCSQNSDCTNNVCSTKYGRCVGP